MEISRTVNKSVSPVTAESLVVAPFTCNNYPDPSSWKPLTFPLMDTTGLVKSMALSHSLSQEDSPLVKKLQAENEKMKTEINTLRTSISRITLVSDSVKLEVAILQKENTTHQNANKALQLKNTALRNEKAMLEAANTVLQKENATLMADKATLQTANMPLQQDNTTLQTANTALQKENTTLRTANAALQKENTTLQTANTALEIELTTANQNLRNEEKKKFLFAEDLIQSLKRELTSLNTQCSADKQMQKKQEKVICFLREENIKLKELSTVDVVELVDLDEAPTGLPPGLDPDISVNKNSKRQKIDSDK